MTRLILLLGITLVSASNLAAEPLPECLTDKYDRYANARKSWQRSLTQLVIKAAPRHEEVARSYLADQLRHIEQAELAVRFLAHQQPDKLRTSLPLNNWLSLEDADHQRIAAASRRYTVLLKQSAERQTHPPHPDSDGLREVMRTKVMESDEYTELLEAFSQQVRAAEALQCREK